MGDMADDFAAMKAHRQAQHEEWRQRNTNIIATSGVSFRSANHGETFCFRERGKPMVDFYPSTGRWRVVGAKSRTFRGGAEAFLRWYEKQSGA